MDSTVACLGAGELRGADDRASRAALVVGDYLTRWGRIERKDRVRAGCPARTLSNAGGRDGDLSRGCTLVTGAPRGRLRSDRVRWINVDAGGGELHRLCVGSGGAQRDGLELALTV